MLLAASIVPVHIKQQHCLNNRIRGIHCRKCETVCPKQSMYVATSDREDAVLVNDNCSGCGLCVAACPAGAVSIGHRLPEKLKQNEGAVELNCCKRQLDGAIDCLGMLDAYTLSYIGMRTEQVKVMLDKPLCKECNPGMPAAVLQAVSAANVFLQKFGRPAIKLVLQHGKAEAVIGRRDLFAFCFSRAKATLLDALPLSLKGEESPRAGLVELIAWAAKDVKLTSLAAAPLFWGAKADRKCELCGICVRACKNEALILRADRKKQQIQLLHNQSKCYGCRACQLLCPQHCLEIQTELSSIKSVGSRLPVVVTSGKCCSECGGFLPDREQSQCDMCSWEKTPFVQAIY